MNFQDIFYIIVILLLFFGSIISHRNNLKLVDKGWKNASLQIPVFLPLTTFLLLSFFIYIKGINKIETILKLYSISLVPILAVGLLTLFDKIKIK